MEGARRPHYQVTFAILAVGIGAYALLQSLVIPVLSTVQVELHTSQSAVTMFVTGLGVGFGLAFSAMSANIVSAVPAEQTGAATGMNANIRTIGGSIGAAVMASIVTAKLEPSGLPVESGYTTGFGIMAGVLVVAALAGLLIPSRQRARGRAGEEAAVGTLAMSGDAVTAESAAGETVASELGE